jgi:hypothetical protein
MSQSDLQGDTNSGDAGTSFPGRPPSQTWEKIFLIDDPQNFVWVWFKPPNVPQGLVVSIPDETYQSYAQRDEQLTMRKLLQAVGVQPGCFSMWYLYGVAYDGMHGTNPLLNSTIPRPETGVDPNIVVCIDAPPVDTMQHAAADTEPGSPPDVFERIEADWNASLEIEKDLTRLRKKLLDMSAKLNTLNRELSSQERLHSSSQDKKDWADVRRRLRDTDTRLRMCIKEHSIGDASRAGRRNWFEQTYLQFIVPRQQFDGMQQAQRDFESHRKLVQTLQTSMNTAYSTAAQDGERNALQVLNRIAAKVREASAKKNFLDAMRD